MLRVSKHVVFQHGVHEGQEFSHAGDGDDLEGLARFLEKLF
jgi:hypothetical protein